MTPRAGPRALATAAAVAAKGWLIEPAEQAEPREPRDPAGWGDTAERHDPPDPPDPRDPGRLPRPARLHPVPPSPHPAARRWLAPSAGGPAVLAPAEAPHAESSTRPAVAPPPREPLSRLPETPVAAVAVPPEPLVEPVLPLDGRGVVAVIGLGRRCGATVVARALACELARRDGAGASAVTADLAGGGMALGLPAAGRLARALALAGVGRLRSCGRLCLVETADRPALAGATLYLAPLVLDDCDPREAPVTAAIADHLVIVGGRGVEPALATALAASLTPHAAGRPVIVANRVSGPDDPWAERADVLLPESRLGAQLALAGREPRGALGRAVIDLGDRLEASSNA